MHRIPTARVLLGILGIVFFLANPAGICAGMPSADTSHPCCPKPTADAQQLPCVCIDRQPAAPTLPGIGELMQMAALAPIIGPTADAPVSSPEFAVEEAARPAPQSIILSIHQLLL